jgi:hypothetical protein
LAKEVSDPRGLRWSKATKKIRLLAFVGQECPTDTVRANPQIKSLAVYPELSLQFRLW